MLRFFKEFVGRLGRKVGSLKRQVRSHVFRGDMKNSAPLWREAHLQLKMYKTHLGRLFEVQLSKNGTRLWREAHLQLKMHKTPQSRATFRSSAVEKWHAAVARNTFATQNAQNTPFPGHFSKFSCQKMARRCGTKHTCNSKIYKTHQSRVTFRSSAVEKWHAAVARSAFAPQNVQNTPFPDHFFKFSCRKMARRCGTKHISKSK